MPLALPIPRGALIVSCQARVDNPLHGPDHMAAMAAAAEQGGARAIRANGAADISTIRKATRLPIVGIAKRFSKQFAVYITPDIGDAVAIAEAGCSLIALDATARPRDGMALELLIPAVKQRTGLPVFADIASVEEARNALQLGADCVATTLSGYTVETAARWAQGPDLDLVAALADVLECPVIAEGRYESPEHVREAFRRGAFAVVVGTAITNPREITRRFVAGGTAS